MFQRGKDQQFLKQTPRINDKNAPYDDPAEYHKKINNIRNKIITFFLSIRKVPFFSLGKNAIF